MEMTSTKAELVHIRDFPESVTATIPRADFEAALGFEEPAELFLEVKGPKATRRTSASPGARRTSSNCWRRRPAPPSRSPSTRTSSSRSCRPGGRCAWPPREGPDPHRGSCRGRRRRCLRRVGCAQRGWAGHRDHALVRGDARRGGADSARNRCDPARRESRRGRPRRPRHPDVRFARRGDAGRPRHRRRLAGGLARRGDAGAARHRRGLARGDA